jgi:hypothetical protein
MGTILSPSRSAVSTHEEGEIGAQDRQAIEEGADLALVELAGRRGLELDERCPRRPAACSCSLAVSRPRVITP